jgi:hypothetical protein
MGGKSALFVEFITPCVVGIPSRYLQVCQSCVQRLTDRGNDSSSLGGNKEEEESLLATEMRRTNLFNFPKLESATPGVLQLHIHVVPDLKGINDFSHVFPI